MKKITLSTLIICGIASTGFSQNVGISEPSPDSKLDVVQTETTGSSIEVSHNVTTNTYDAVWIKNSGLGRAFHAQNLLGTSNTPVGRFLQMGNGVNALGLLLEMNSTTVASAIGLLIAQNGLGIGSYTLMPAGNASPGAVIDHAGSGDGMFIYQSGTGFGIYNQVDAGIGHANVIGTSSAGTYNLLTAAGGIGVVTDLGTKDGVGVSVVAVDNLTTPTAGGDVIGLDATVRTATATVGTVVSGAALAGEQYGIGHGILVNHYGASGRNAEFNIEGTTNPDPAIFVTHSGLGSAIVGQNQNNTLPGVISVANFAYTGADVDDHIGVQGYSSPTDGFGIGSRGIGGWIGVFGAENSASALAGVYADGDLAASGTKPFIIDHPSDPANKMLRHFALESDEVLNVYRGNIVLDANGKATVELPEYFDVINIDFSYQLTAIGTPVHPYVLTEVEGNSFEVAGEPNTKVSWMIMAQRNDPYLQQNPDKKENIIEKEGERKGKYLTPELYNQPESKGMFYHENNVDMQPSSIDRSKTGFTQKKLDEMKSNLKEHSKAERPVIKE